MKKKLVIVHDRPGKNESGAGINDNEKHWISWLKTEAENLGFTVYNPQMPIPWEPEFLLWEKEFKSIPVDENSILVGHSAGGAFLVRWLADTKTKIRKLILVAPAKSPNPHKEHAEIYEFAIDSAIQDYAGEIVVIFSSDDMDWIVESSKLYTEKLSARVIEFNSRGHLTLNDMGTEEFPELLREIKNTYE